MALDSRPKYGAEIIHDGDFVSLSAKNTLPVQLFTPDHGDVQLTSTAVNLSASGANQLLIATVAGARILVYQGFIAAATANTVTFQSTTTAITGPIGMIAGGQIQFPNTGEPWLVTGSGQPLRATMGGSATFAGILHYKTST